MAILTGRWCTLVCRVGLQTVVVGGHFNNSVHIVGSLGFLIHYCQFSVCRASVETEPVCQKHEKPCARQQNHLKIRWKQN
jgi:hypothetical protein